jgi:hypothetical protein
MGKMKKKVNFGVLRISPYVSNGVSQSCLDPIGFNQSEHTIKKRKTLHHTQMQIGLHFYVPPSSPEYTKP